MRAGFERGLRDFQADAVGFHQTNIDHSLVEIRDAFEMLMRSEDAPDGIVSGSGSGAIALIAGLEMAKKKLGEDCDMVSKSPSDFLRWLRPEVMTMYEDIRVAGRELAKAVIGHIDGQPPETLQSLSQPEFQPPITRGLRA